MFMRSGPTMVTSASARLTRCLPFSPRAPTASIEAVHVRVGAQPVRDRINVGRQLDGVGLLLRHGIRIKRRRLGIRRAATMRLRSGRRLHAGGEDGEQNEFAWAIDHDVHPTGYVFKISTKAHSVGA